MRADIDVVNIELLRLLEARAALARAIIRKKAYLGRPAFDQNRERVMLERIVNEARGPYSAEQLTKIFSCIFAASRELPNED